MGEEKGAFFFCGGEGMAPRAYVPFCLLGGSPAMILSMSYALVNMLAGGGSIASGGMVILLIGTVDRRASIVDGVGRGHKAMVMMF